MKMKIEEEKQEEKKHISILTQIFGKVDWEAIKKLEEEGHTLSEKYCNGDIDEGTFDILLNDLKKRIKKVLGTNIPIIMNTDPRGYFLKIDSGWVAKHRKDVPIIQDWGGYGIICPDFLYF